MLPDVCKGTWTSLWRADALKPPEVCHGRVDFLRRSRHHGWDVPELEQCDVCSECKSNLNRQTGHTWNCSHHPNVCKECLTNLQRAGGHRWNCSRHLDVCEKCGNNLKRQHGHRWNCLMHADVCKECANNLQRQGGHKPGCSMHSDVCDECRVDMRLHRGHIWNCSRHPDVCEECGSNVQRQRGHRWDCSRHPDVCEECGNNLRRQRGHKWDCSVRPDVCEVCGSDLRQRGHRGNCPRLPEVCGECGYNVLVNGTHAPTCPRMAPSGEDVCGQKRSQSSVGCQRHARCGCDPSGSDARGGAKVPSTPDDAKPPPAFPTSPTSPRASDMSPSTFPRALSDAQANAQRAISKIRSDLSGRDGGERKTTLRRLQLRWHPDKNVDNQDTASIVFCYVRAEWERLQVFTF